VAAVLSARPLFASPNVDKEPQNVVENHDGKARHQCVATQHKEWQPVEDQRPSTTPAFGAGRWFAMIRPIRNAKPPTTAIIAPIHNNVLFIFWPPAHGLLERPEQNRTVREGRGEVLRRSAMEKGRGGIQAASQQVDGVEAITRRKGEITRSDLRRKALPLLDQSPSREKCN